MTGSEMNNPHSKTEEKLRQALHVKADSVTTAPHALDEIQARIDGVVVPNATVTQLHQPRPIVRYVSIAAVLLVAVGGFAYLSQRRTVTNLDVAIDTTTTVEVETPTPTTTEPVTEPTTEPTQTTLESSIIAQTAIPTGPIADTQTAAAKMFLARIGMDGPAEYTDGDGFVSVRRPDSENEIVRVQTRVADGGQGWVVTGASSDGITAELEDYDPADVSSLVVKGKGRGYEAALDISLVSALDGSLIHDTYATGGMPDPKPYSVEIPVVGSEVAWVVVRGDDAAGDEETALQEFAAVPVSYEALSDQRTFGVFRIETADSDKGLNLRSSPGTDENTVLATLPAGTPGIRRTASLPVLDGDAVWREVVTPDGQTGWAHSNFLTSLEPITDQELLYIGNQLAQASQEDTHSMFRFLPWSDRVQVAFAWTGDLDNKDFRFDYEDLTDSGLWGPDAYRDWGVHPAAFDQPIISATHREFLSLPQGAELEVSVGDGTYAYDFEKAKIDSFVPNLRSVVISNLNSDGPWSAVHLFVEPTPTGPQIIAVAVSHMVP